MFRRSPRPRGGRHAAPASVPDPLASNTPAVPVWVPTDAEVAESNLAAFVRDAAAAHPELAGVGPGDHDRLHRWSVERPEAFWAAVWRHVGVVADERGGAEPWDRVLSGDGRMAPPAEWTIPLGSPVVPDE